MSLSGYERRAGKVNLAGLVRAIDGTPGKNQDMYGHLLVEICSYVYSASSYLPASARADATKTLYIAILLQYYFER